MTTAFPFNTFRVQIFHRPRCYLFTKSSQPNKLHFLKCSKKGGIHQSLSKMKKWDCRGSKYRVLWVKQRDKMVVMVRSNQGFGFNGGDNGGGGGRNVDGRMLGNLALGLGLFYLSFTGQLGWVLDAIVSIWLLAVVVPLVGLGVFLWWVGRDMIQSTCPNCGNAFKVFKSSLNGDLQLCPFCSQPFSVQENEFVKEPIKFSSMRSASGKSDEFTPWSRKGKDTSIVVDVEAEVKDAD